MIKYEKLNNDSKIDYNYDGLKKYLHNSGIKIPPKYNDDFNDNHKYYKFNDDKIYNDKAKDLAGSYNIYKNYSIIFDKDYNKNDYKKRAIPNPGITYEDLLKEINSRYISGPLKEHLIDILPSFKKLYGEFIDWGNVNNVLSITKILYSSKENYVYFRNNPNVAGVWRLTYFHPSGILADCSLAVRSHDDVLKVKDVAAHEGSHFLAQKFHKVTDPIAGTNHVASGFIIGYSKDSIGTALNEGFAEYVAENVMTAVNLRNGRIRTYNISPFYKFQYDVAKKLHKMMGDKVFEAFFKNPFVVANAFDSVLGDGSWKVLMRKLDHILAVESKELYVSEEELIKLKYDIDYILECYKMQKCYDGSHSTSTPFKPWSVEEARKLVSSLAKKSLATGLSIAQAY